MSNPNQYHRVATAVERAILRSFTTRPLRGHRITSGEVRRRFALCEGIVGTLSALGWSTVRIADHVYVYLIAEIDGAPWEPSNRASWVISHKRGSS